MDWTVLLTGPGLIGAGLVVGCAIAIIAYPMLRIFGSPLCNEDPLPALFVFGVAIILMPSLMTLAATYLTSFSMLWRLLGAIAAWGGGMILVGKWVSSGTQ